MQVKFNSTSPFSNLSQKKINAFNTNLFEGKVIIDFSNSLHSIDLPTIYFKNYFKSKKDNFYKFFKKTCRSMMKNENFPINEEFEIDKTIDVPKDKNKIIDIILNTTGIDYSNCTIFRMKHKFSTGVQFYYIVTSDSCKILLIDLYHMALFAVEKGSLKVNNYPKSLKDNYDSHNIGYNVNLDTLNY